MKLINYHPLSNVRTFNNFFDDFFTRSIGDFLGTDDAFNIPSVNIFETRDDFRVEVAAPGLERADFAVNVEKGFLNISANREKKEEVKEGRYTRREFSYGTFSRRFQLPDSVLADQIAARYENGVLYISLPKREEAKIEAARVIEIK